MNVFLKVESAEFRNYKGQYLKCYLTVHYLKKKNFCKITVEDNGGGIPEEIIDKIFDPFFTDRKNGGGTGLGLSVCHSIIKEHNGKINVKSFNSKTKFIISLPFEESVK